jgi:hypothetical protein
MTYLASGATRVLSLALAVASLSPSACYLVGGSCSCPQLGNASAFIPAARSSPIVSVTSGPQCTASYSEDGSVSVNANSTSTTACGVIVVLMNGDVYSFLVQFREFDPGGCCAGIQGFVQGQPMQTDGGVDASDGG